MGCGCSSIFMILAGILLVMGGCLRMFGQWKLFESIYARIIPFLGSGFWEDNPMRALCGAIITAGALIGLGLTALGYGLRYAGPAININPNTGAPWGSSNMMVILIVLLIMLVIGLGIAFLGLAFHHYRRYHEHLRETGRDRENRVSNWVGGCAPRRAVEWGVLDWSD
jgi:hypothetical protein